MGGLVLNQLESYIQPFIYYIFIHIFSLNSNLIVSYGLNHLNRLNNLVLESHY